MPTEQQPRLKVGPFVLVPTGPAGATCWALPGGGRATYGDLTRWARAQGWKRPEMQWATVRRAEIRQEEPREPNIPMPSPGRVNG
jgi:hypothetical protein